MRYAVYSDHDCPILNIACLGSAKNPKVTRFGPAVRDSWILHFILSGRGYFNGTPVSAGQGFIITPGLAEHYFPDEDAPWEYVWITSNDERISVLTDLLQADRQTGVFSFGHTDALRRTADFCITHEGEHLSGFDLLEQVSRLFKHRAAPDGAVRSNGQLYLDSALRYIDLNLQSPITVGELTAFLGITQPYLFKLFKAQFGRSPKQYILDRKLDRAQTLLRQTDLSITHIANSVGFPDVLSFSKCFKAKLGRSPQAYRAEASIQ